MPFPTGDTNNTHEVTFRAWCVGKCDSAAVTLNNTQSERRVQTPLVAQSLRVRNCVT